MRDLVREKDWSTTPLGPAHRWPQSLKTLVELCLDSTFPAVITSSNEDKDQLAAYDHFANSYVRKPVDYDHFVTASRDLGLYWLVLNQPAPRRG